MQNLQNDLIELLKHEDSLVVDGQLNKNKIVEKSLQVDPKLLKLLLQHDTFKNHFFTDVDGIMVFDKIKFQRFVNNKSFLPDSYTAFKNKIGLTINDGTTENYINTKNDVVLAWPHKDCVLEGGQTKEEQKRNEIFWNETLAPDEIDRLLDPKVFTKWQKYDQQGEHEVTEITSNDNLIIKGNNLLALASLEKRYLGKIKLIYIDPPYNTGSDSFQYNDSFNHSSWLTFTKNRLIQAKKLLKNDGAIFVHIDHHQLGYLNVLMDEVFGISNKVQVISIKTASPAGFKTVNPGPIDVTEYILFYTKNKTQFQFRKNYVPVGYNSNYNLYLERADDVKEWKFTPIKQKVIESAGFADEKEAKEKYGKLWNSIVKVMIEDFAFENADNVVSIRDPHKPTEKVKSLMEQSKECDFVIPYKREDDSFMYLYKGGSLAFYSKKMIEIDGKNEITELLTDFWDHISWAGIANEGGVKLKNGKKPEKLLKQIFEIGTNKGDIVLDYHLGSGTTCAVAHKMGLKYIGVEQLDYKDNDSIVRLINVINKDQTGISKAVRWQGGGSFIYCELAKYNQTFADQILEADSKENLLAIWNEICRLKNQITPFVSRSGVLFVLANAFDNLQNLGFSYIVREYDKQSMLTFLVEILNWIIDKVEDCYYHLDSQKHIYYDAYDDDYIRNVAADSNWDVATMNPVNCRYDLDCDPSKPLEVVPDWGSKINLFSVGQERKFNFVTKIAEPCDCFINEFYNKPQESNKVMITDLVDQFCTYYENHGTKRVLYYRDKYGDNRQPNVKNALSYNNQAIEHFKTKGWNVETKSHSGMEPPQHDKYLLWMNILKSGDPRFPKVIFNGKKCKYTLISMNNTKVIERNGKFDKDKGSERSKKILPEEATHFSDAVDKRIWTKYGKLLYSKSAVFVAPRL